VNPVRAALRRPFTVLVAVFALALAGLGAWRSIPRDLLPQLGIPTIYVAQPYAGMSPAQMEGLLTYYYEYHFLYLTGIEHVESRSVQGNSLIKLQFHPGTNMVAAMAEVVAYVNRSRAFMPAGTVPPFIMRFDAGSLPVGNLVFSSETRSLPEIQDVALNRVRPLFATLPGVSAPPPFGGSARTIVVHAEPARLQASGLSPDDLVTAVLGANSISPAGSLRLGQESPLVPSNAQIVDLSELETVPVKVGPQGTVLLRDVARVEDGSDLPTAYALVNGRRTVYIPVTKRAGASTLNVVRLVKQNLARFQQALPNDVKVSYEFDQSPAVEAALASLTQEALLGAALTGLMVLLFLRDARSALIVILNIPLALLGAVAGLWWMGETLNLMTLGGLALAVGVLVDESTVTMEAIHHHLADGKPLARAVADSGAEVAVPLLLSMLCVVSVFIPALFMAGAARALFVPLALAVGLAMGCSYLLSRTLVPVLSCWWLKAGNQRGSFIPRWYSAWLERAGPLLVLLYLAGLAAALVALGSSLGQEIFPRAGETQYQLRLRAPSGTRLERTEELVKAALQVIEAEAGPSLEITLAFVGTHPSSYPINNIYLWTSGPEEAVVQFRVRTVQPDLARRVRARLEQALPGVSLSFEPSGLLDRALSLGAPTPIEIDITGPTLKASREYAEKLMAELTRLGSLSDLQLAPSLDYPSLEVRVDRVRAATLGTSAAAVARSVVVGTSSSRFVAPSYWMDPTTGIAYQLQVEVPWDRISSVEDLLNLPVQTGQGAAPLRNLAQVTPGEMVGEYDRYNMQRYVTLTANLARQDLGTAARQVQAVLARTPAPAKVTATLRGQVPPLEQLQSGLREGVGLALLVIFLLLAANFQSLRLPLVVLSSAPAALAGALTVLCLAGDTLNLQSLMGLITCLGIAVANAILLVTAAESARRSGLAAREAGAVGARARWRPIVMTTLAMLAGMLPMALSGGTSAPLARAVLGGLVGSTLASLGILPAVFALVMRGASTESASLDPEDA